MTNKILIKLYVLPLTQYYDIYIPVNEVVWKIKKLIIKSINELAGVSIEDSQNYILMDIETGTIYQNNEIILNTNIRNYSKLILINTINKTKE